MKEEAFISKNAVKWERLEQYNKKVGSAGNLAKQEMLEFAELYNIVGYHLAYSRTHFNKSKTTEYLNRLVAISHNYFYKHEKTESNNILSYFKVKFPCHFRKHSKMFLSSLTIFFLGMIFAFLLNTIDQSYIHYFLPKEIAEGINLGSSGVSSISEQWDFLTMSAIIMTNNISVCFRAFAFGILAGIGTIYILFFNGIVVGAFASIASTNASNALVFWSLILPHGFLELTAIFLSGAAGLIIGKSILIPNELSRKHSLIKGAKEAALLIPGIVVMLVIAAIIEGFFTPLNISVWVKLCFSFVTLFGIIAYFIFTGRKLEND